MRDPSEVTVIRCLWGYWGFGYIAILLYWNYCYIAICDIWLWRMSRFPERNFDLDQILNQFEFTYKRL